MPHGGKRAGAGNPGYKKLEFIAQQAELTLPLWWKTITKWLHSKDASKVKFALQELNKVQVKMMPQELTGNDGGPIQLEWLSKSPTIHADGPSVSTTVSNAGIV